MLSYLDMMSCTQIPTLVNLSTNKSDSRYLCLKTVYLSWYDVTFEEHLRSKYTEIDDIVILSSHFFAPQLLLIKYTQKPLYNYLWYTDLEMCLPFILFFFQVTIQKFCIMQARHTKSNVTAQFKVWVNGWNHWVVHWISNKSKTICQSLLKLTWGLLSQTSSKDLVTVQELMLSAIIL